MRAVKRTAQFRRDFKRVKRGALSWYAPSLGQGQLADLVSVIETGVDPWGENVEELLEWLGGWDPATFDLAAWKRRFDARTALPQSSVLATARPLR